MSDQAQRYEYVRRLWLGDGYQNEMFDEKNNSWINMSQGNTIDQIRNNNKSAYERRKKSEWARKTQRDNQNSYQYNTRPTRRRKQRPKGDLNIPNDFFCLRERSNAPEPPQRHLRGGSTVTASPPHKERNNEYLRHTLDPPRNKKREGIDTRITIPRNKERNDIDLRAKLTAPKAQPPSEIRERRKIDPAELTLSSDSETETSKTRINYKLEAIPSYSTCPSKTSTSYS